MWQNFFKKKECNAEKEKIHLKTVINNAKKSSDFVSAAPITGENRIYISFYKSLIDMKNFQEMLLSCLKQHKNQFQSLDDIKNMIPIEDMEITDDAGQIQQKLLNGYALLQMHSNDSQGLLINLENSGLGIRQTNETENEFSLVGPKIGFIENIEANIHLLRRKMVSMNLITEEITVGSTSKTKIIIAYVEGLINPEHVHTVKQRLEDLDVDVVYDNSMLDQLTLDNTSTPFPLMLHTERLDRVVYGIQSGKVAIFSDGSPTVRLGPANLFDFFISPEDYFLPWMTGSFFRIIRIFGVLFSLCAGALYVAILTYHYEVIPHDLLASLISSRANVPFSPILEVLFLEITIELLREAGARLPTKIGQTLGIVGGIVIGEASVQAALTSNILLIVVSLSALASFTTPIFKMSNTIRIIRFPILILAAIWGGLGIFIGLILLWTHLLRLKSLGTPYTVPLYPFRPKGFGDTFIRPPFEQNNKIPSFARPLRSKRYSPKQHKDLKEGIDHE